MALYVSDAHWDILRLEPVIHLYVYIQGCLVRKDNVRVWLEMS
jgi:hypothetical protein